MQCALKKMKYSNLIINKEVKRTNYYKIKPYLNPKIL